MDQPTRRRGLTALGLFAPFLLSAALAPGAAAAQPAGPPPSGPATAAASEACTRLGPDTAITVTGTYRVKNPDCSPGPWKKAAAGTRLNLTDGDYVESRGRGSSCTHTQNGTRGIPKDGSTYCGPAWETRNDPIPGSSW